MKLLKYLHTPPVNERIDKIIKERYPVWHAIFQHLSSSNIIITPMLLDTIRTRTNNQLHSRIDANLILNSVSKDDILCLIDQKQTINDLDKFKDVLLELNYLILNERQYLSTYIIIFFVDVIKTRFKFLYTNESFKGFLKSAKNYNLINDNYVLLMLVLKLTRGILTSGLYNKDKPLSQVILRRKEILHGRPSQSLSCIHLKNAFIYLDTILFCYKTLRHFTSSSSLVPSQQRSYMGSHGAVSNKLPSSRQYLAITQPSKFKECLHNSFSSKIQTNVSNFLRDIPLSCKTSIHKINQIASLSKSEPGIIDNLAEKFSQATFTSALVHNSNDIRIIPSKEFIQEFGVSLLFKKGEELRKKIDEYYVSHPDRLLDLCNSCYCSIEAISPNDLGLYKDVLFAFQSGGYHTACFGLVMILEHVVAIITDAADNVIDSKHYRKINATHDFDDDLYDNLFKNVLNIKSQLFEQSIFGSESTIDEDNRLNRHAIVHGRYKKSYDKLDAITLLISLHGIIQSIRTGISTN